MECPFRGSIVALPTPFDEKEALDLEALRGLVQLHAGAATEAVVVAGTTGEAPTLTPPERIALIETAVEAARGKLPVIAGVGTNCTRTTVELAREAVAAGAHGLLVVTPYYNRPGARGLLTHFSRVAEATGAPIMLYDVPARTGVELPPEVARELRRRHPNVVAAKVATTCVERIRRFVQEAGIATFCGEDRRLAESAAVGAAGAVSVVGNLRPAAVAELLEHGRPQAEGGDPERAREVAARLAPLIEVLAVEVNPVPVKAALEVLGRCAARVREPLVALEDANRARIEAVLASHAEPCSVLVGA